MQSTKINLRVKNILQRIFAESGYITITTIAKDLGLSSRTILRELPAVEEWLAKRDFKLDKKAGAGIRINRSPEDRNRLMSLLAEEKEEKIFTPRERQTIITSELLRCQEPVKLYNFTKVLNITEGTISNDLDKVEEWLKLQGLTLVRKQGLGVYIEGDEDKIRKCMINLIYDNINENYLIDFMRKGIHADPVPVSNTELIARSMLLNLVDSDTIHKLENLVQNTEEYIGHALADSSYIGLIVHLAIAVQRITQNEDITMDKCFIDELKMSKEYSVAEKLGFEIENIFGIKVPEDEIGYITMHIKGSKNIDIDEKESNKTIENDDLVKLSKEIIRIAENETGKLLSQDEKLLSGLVNHLGPALSRLRMNLQIRNPLYKEIKNHYPDLLQLAGKCVEEVEKAIGIKIPETEVAYIAMHLGAGIEKNRPEPKRIYRVAAACPTGIGTSRLLSTRIEKEYDDIFIVDTVSTLHIDQSWLRDKGIEFVISTVRIDECPVPVVIVNPLLFDEDKLKIARMISQLKSTSFYQATIKKSTSPLKDKMQDLNNYGKAVTEILDNFFMKEDSQAEDINGLISEVSKYISLSKANTEKLESALKVREEKGGTFIKDYGILLLHCRTEAVDKLYFGAIKLFKEINGVNNRTEKERVELGIVLLAPEDCNKYLLEAISYVSGMLIEKADFVELLKSGTKEEVFNELSNILEGFYKLKYNKLLRDQR
jgi:mannitol operon transcriptional antiterminator